MEEGSLGTVCHIGSLCWIHTSVLRPVHEAIGSSNLDAHLTACMCFSSAGLSLDGAGDVGISLGTSDTVRLSESVAASSRFCSCSQYHGVTPWAV